VDLEPDVDGTGTESLIGKPPAASRYRRGSRLVKNDERAMADRGELSDPPLCGGRMATLISNSTLNLIKRYCGGPLSLQ
jgi:hypothetical protein